MHHFLMRHRHYIILADRFCSRIAIIVISRMIGAKNLLADPVSNSMEASSW